MIDKITYESMKRENRYGLPLFYDYYLEHFHLTGRLDSDKMSYETFEAFFPKWPGIMGMPGEGVAEKVTKFYDQKFGL